jgi:predicted RNA-binding protein
MSDHNYWLDLFTGVTWNEFLAAGGDVSGFRESRWSVVQKIKSGDYLLCYLTGVSRFIGVLEVVSAPFRSSGLIWKDEDFPCRLKVKPVVVLTPETALPVLELRDVLSIFRDMKSAIAWTGHFRGSPTKWKSSDGSVVLSALLEAKKNPNIRPVDPAKLAKRPRALKAKMGSVTVPESEGASPPEQPEIIRERSDHEEIQWLLLKLGSDMGFDVWVARNDRGRQSKGQQPSEILKLKKELPLQFDEATNRTIELIDVLWLNGNAIVAAFEIESTTSIYSGLLRMSDLIAMQPNLNIPLYLVAPDERRQKVIDEVNSPTFRRLSPPLFEVCRFISFSDLRSRLKEAGPLVRYLKPEFLEELSESCEIEEA